MRKTTIKFSKNYRMYDEVRKFLSENIKDEEIGTVDLAGNDNCIELFHQGDIPKTLNHIQIFCYELCINMFIVSSVHEAIDTRNLQSRAY